jgi:hypothetical protein
MRDSEPSVSLRFDLGRPPFMWAGVILAILIAFPIRSLWLPSMTK